MASSAIKIIALAQSKGGASKSTTAIHLACEAFHEGESAAILDMDEGQLSSMKWAKRRSVHSLDGPLVLAVKAINLRGELQRLSAEGVSWAFIDLPGRDAPVSSAGIVAAHFVIIPSRPTTIDFEASITTVQSCVRAGKRYAYLLTAVQPQGNKSEGRQFRTALELLPVPPPVCPHMIGQRVEIARAIAAGRSVRETKPEGEAAKEFEELFRWLKRTVP
jgi:chromosome partitioning protein